MKLCTGCGTEKSDAEFYRNSSARSGLTSRCKECCDARAAAYRKENAEAIRAHRVADADRIRRVRAAQWAANSERGRVRNAVWRAANSASIKARQNARRAANAERLNGYLRSYHLAKKLEKFGISKEEYEAKLVEQDYRCPICSDAYVSGEAKHRSLPVMEHSHAREVLLDAPASLRGIVCNTCNRARISRADQYLKKHGILDTDPRAFPALLKRKVPFAEQIARHVTGEWRKDGLEAGEPPGGAGDSGTSADSAIGGE